MNVVLIVADDLMVDGFSRMPYLSSLDTVDFPNSFLCTPLCTPSRYTLLTGMYPSRHGVLGNSSNEIDHDKLLPVALSRVGVTSAIYGKLDNDFREGHHTLQGWSDTAIFESGRDYYDYTLRENGVDVGYGSTDADYSTDVLCGKAVDFVTNASEPFFCYLPVYAPHGVAEPATRHAGYFDGVTPDRRANHNEADISDKPQWLQDTYPETLTAGKVTTRDNRRRDGWECLLALDEGIEDIITALTNRGILDETVIIFMGDNGESFMEHRIIGKAHPYEEAIFADVRVLWPGVAGRTDTSLVSSIDIAPTVAKALGARLLRAPDGMDLGPLVRQEVSNWRTDIVIEHITDTALDCPTFTALRTADAKLVSYYDGTQESYDLSADPYELANLGANSTLAARLALMETGGPLPETFTA